jgi:sterol-4alpha-carboxylate 3-dehydrogenase (decarboxylating)
VLMEIQSVVVTGGAGFVGRAIARALRERHPGCLITMVDLQRPSSAAYADANMAFAQADVTCPQSILDALIQSRPEVIIHTAGIVPPLGERHARRMEKEVFRVNVEGTRNTLHAAKAAGCAAFVYTSSCCAIIDDLSKDYANIDERWRASPTSSIYGESKVNTALVWAQIGR